MGDTTLEIVIPEENIEATLDAIRFALPESATILPPVIESQSLGEAFQVAALAAGDLPSVLGAWWLEARRVDGMDPAVSMLLAALAFVAAFGIERGVRALVLKRDAVPTPEHGVFTRKLGRAMRWGVHRVLLLLRFCEAASPPLSARSWCWWRYRRWGSRSDR